MFVKCSFKSHVVYIYLIKDLTPASKIKLGQGNYKGHERVLNETACLLQIHVIETAV